MFDPYQPTPQDWRQQQMVQQEAMRQAAPVATTTNSDLFSPILADDVQGALSEIMARAQRAAEQKQKQTGQSQTGSDLVNLFAGGHSDTMIGGGQGSQFGSFTRMGGGWG